MWLVVPGCSPSPQEQEDSTSVSGWLFEALERSATLRTNSRHARSWRLAWRKERWIQRLCGRTPTPSTATRGVERWISSLRDIPASHSASPANDSDSRIPATSGPPSFGSSMRCVHEESSLRFVGLVLPDLRRAGYGNAEAILAPASAVGAPHKRKRLFAVADAQSGQWCQQRGLSPGPAGGSAPLVDVVGTRWTPTGERRWQHAGAEPEAGGGAGLGDAHGGERSGGQAGRYRAERGEGLSGRRGRAGMDWPPGPDDTGGWSRVDERFWPALPEPALRRVADGVARGMDLSRSDRLRIAGNGVVPQQAALAISILLEQMECER